MNDDVLSDDALWALVCAHAPLRPTPLVPTLRACTADDELALWQALEDALRTRIGAPFFAVAWPGAQALARVALDGIADVRGAIVADVGCGSGLSCVGALVAGAQRVIAIDVDALALRCVKPLVRAHGLDDARVTCVVGDAVHEPAVVGDATVVWCGDLVYSQQVGARLPALVATWQAQGRRVVLADSGRPFFSPCGLPERARYVVDVPERVDGARQRTVRVWA